MASPRRRTTEKTPAKRRPVASKKADRAAAAGRSKKANTTARAGAKKPKAAQVPVSRALAEPDEFGASGAYPAVGVPGLDRSFAPGAVRELSWTDFDRLVQVLAKATKSFRPHTVVGLVHGGVFVGGALASALRANFLPARVNQRSRDHRSEGPIVDELPAELKGRRVLIVDDIAASGDSLELALRAAKARGVRKTATAALVARPGRYLPNYSALESDELFVFPWDYAPLVNDGRFDPTALRRPIGPVGPGPRGRLKQRR